MGMNESPAKKRCIDHAGLMELVQSVVADQGGPTAVAAKMGMSQPAISQAIRDPKPSYDGMRIRILETLGGYVIAPAWNIQRPRKATAR